MLRSRALRYECSSLRWYRAMFACFAKLLWASRQFWWFPLHNSSAGDSPLSMMQFLSRGRRVVVPACYCGGFGKKTKLADYICWS